MSAERMEIRIVLEKEFIEKIDLIKSFLGLKNSTELFRYLLTKEYREIKDSEKIIILGPGTYVFNDGIPIKVEKNVKKKKGIFEKREVIEFEE